jgi:hypothetical protein
MRMDFDAERVTVYRDSNLGATGRRVRKEGVDLVFESDGSRCWRGPILDFEPAVIHQASKTAGEELISQR